MKKFRRILSAVLTVAMIAAVASFTGIGAANIAFTDVSGHWAWTGGQIPYLVEKEVLNGYKDESTGTYSFKPDGEVTRAEFIKMLDETFGLTATTKISYNDISEKDWYYPYFAKAAAQGYILNYGTNGSPNSKITRQEATSLLVRYLDLPANEKASPSEIADYDDISEYFKEYVLRAVEVGIINGYNENGKMYFKPTKTLSRAEALTILYRAAGCIYNNSAYNRDNGAYTTNNTITRGGITISKITFGGRNIITEGASGDTITFSGCTIKGTLYIRGGANVTFDNCTVENIEASGGGKISIVSGTTVEKLSIEKSCDISVLSNTELGMLEVSNGCDNVKVTGNGSIKSAYIYADGFSSAMLPETFEIGNNLTASFGGTVYSGTSSAQNAFTIDPFTTSDGSYYYLNIASDTAGTIYFYYTNSAVFPTVSNFTSYYDSASNYGTFDVRAGKAVTEQTFAASLVKNYSYVAIQLQSGTKKYPPVLIENTTADLTTGFATAPYLSDSTTVKYKVSAPGSVMWFYVEDGANLTQLEFLTKYADQSSALKNETTVNSINTYTCALKESYLSNYDYVAFMFKSSAGLYYTPVILSAGDNGFTEAPVVKTAGIISFKAKINGDLYFYYAENANLPSAANFKSEYNAAKYSGKTSAKNGVADELKYETKYVGDYPYMILAIRNSDGDFMQPVAVNIDLTTGFSVEPKVKDASTISFKTEDYGTVYYYYTKSKTAPTIDDFNDGYYDASQKYKGTVKCSLAYEYIEYKSNYAETYPYMAIMFVDEDDKQYSPVLVELDATSKTGFVIAPYAQDGKVYFSTEADGEVLYFYSRDDSNVDPDDFLSWYQSSSSSRRDTVSVKKDVLASFTVDQSVLEKYPYIILAFREDGDYADEFSFPYVLDVEQSELTKAGSGITVGTPDSDGDVSVTALYDGKLYYYRTDSYYDLPTTSSGFEAKYDSASSGNYVKIEKNDYTYVNMKDYKYLVLCLKVDSGYLSYVIVDAETGVSGGSSFSDGHTKSGTGIDESSVYYSDSFGSAMVTPKHDGTLTLLIVEKGSVVSSKDYSCSANKACEIKLPFSGGNIFSTILGQNTEFYIQLTSGKDVYEAYKLNFIVD